MTIIDEELIILEDLDFEPPCESMFETQGRAATWILKKICCRKTKLICDVCKSKNDEVEKMLDSTVIITCSMCGARGGQDIWIPL